MQPRKDGPASVAILRLLEEKAMGFNELLRALRHEHLVGSGSTLARYLSMLEIQGRIERKVLRAKLPKIVEYRLAKKAPKPSGDVFSKLGEVVGTSDSVTVTLTDLKTGEKRTLTLDKEGEWVSV